MTRPESSNGSGCDVVSVEPAFRVFAYRGTSNLGDAIQTVALCELLPGMCIGIYRDGPFPRAYRNLPLVANGWLGYGYIPDDPDLRPVFAGIHIGDQHEKYIRWIRTCGAAVGARDPHTVTLLRRYNVSALFIGCATLTFKRYTGKRVGCYSIDVRQQEGTIYLSNKIGDIPWSQQWQLAIERLDQIRRAQVVFTSRLHVALPCLAFGTPVVFPSAHAAQVRGRERLSILHAIGFAFDREVVLDVSDLAREYRHFLDSALKCSDKKVGRLQPVSVVVDEEAVPPP